jgi:CubicO group peptidase (beta-lactamase class C family)
MSLPTRTVVTHRVRVPIASAASAALLLAAPAHAQDRTAEVDRVFAAVTADTPGCAVGVSQRGAVVVNKAYGLADVERGRPLTRASRFDIGSAQKQFTAAAVLLLAEEGRLSLDDDVRKHLPQLPDYGRTVTVNHLLTHTSGVRDWTGLLPMAPEGTDVLQLIMRQRGLNFVPGEEWSYSTSGFELAKEIVARVSGKSFAEFARTRLFEPLGMTSTVYAPDVVQAGADAALGYQKEGDGWRPYMRLGTNRGGGAVVSTVGDLLVWNDALASGKLGAFVTEKIQEPARLNNGRTLTYARGLFVETNRGRRMVWHSGGAAGYSTLLSRFPEHGLSVAVTCNFDPVSATALGARVADVFLPPVDARAQPPGPVAAEGADVSGRAGLYFDERTGEPMRLGVTNGRLTIANGPPLVPVTATTFRPPRPDLGFRSQDAFELSFPDPDHIAITSMEGQVTRYRRAQPWTPTAADMQAVEGRYESRELGSVFEIVPGANALTMRMEGAPDRTLTLAPVERDTYMRSLMIVRFRRDAGGRVTGFDYGNPLVRSIAFTRIGGRRGAAAGPGAPAPDIGALVGEYEVAPGRTLTITAEGGQLHGQPPSGTRRLLTHVSGATFAAAGAPITLTFTLGADGRATALVMRQNGDERTLRKIR